MVRILEVIGKRPQGGIGAFITNYQSHFKGDNVKLDYLIFNDAPTGEFDDRVKTMGSNVFVLPELKNKRLFSIWKAIDDFFDSNGKNYDAVHLHSVNIAFMVFPAAKRNGIEYRLAHSHSTVYSDKRINAVRNYILCLGLRKNATHYLACSVAAGDFLFGKANRNRVKVFNNAIDCEKYAFIPSVRDECRRYLNVEDSIVIGHVGRFTKEKNHTYLIDIINFLVKRNEKIRLVLVGDGPLKSDIEKKVRELEIEDKVIFLGRRDDVNRIMMAMDIFVLPSLFEGMPVVGIEAQASGLPCIVSDTITREINLKDVNFESINIEPSVWADDIERMLKNKSGERLEAYKYVESKGFDISVEANKLYELYNGFGNRFS